MFFRGGINPTIFLALSEAVELGAVSAGRTLPNDPLAEVIP